MSAVTDFLRVLTTPCCWLRIYRTSMLWDAELRRLVAERAPVHVHNEFRATIGPHEVWIANHPYASCSPADKKFLPRRSTTLLVIDYIDEYSCIWGGAEASK